MYTVADQRSYLNSTYYMLFSGKKLVWVFLHVGGWSKDINNATLIVLTKTNK